MQQVLCCARRWWGVAALCGWLLPAGAAEPTYQWRQTEGALALLSGERVVWQLNFARDGGKPCFHPLSLANGTVLTALRPADHPWHRGLWWSWKHINGVNYWEEDRKTGLSEGRTEVTDATAEPAADHSARITLQLSYHLPGKAPLMTERRQLAVSAPDTQGNYAIDWTSVFTAGPEDLKLDRTPPKNQAGGYAGLSCRLAPACRSWTYTSSTGRRGAAAIYGAKASWVDLSREGGLAIFDHPDNLRHPSPWYPNDGMPFFSPALLFHEPYVLKAGQTLTLRYRVWVHASAADAAALDKQWQAFAGPRGK